MLTNFLADYINIIIICTATIALALVIISIFLIFSDRERERKSLPHHHYNTIRALYNVFASSIEILPLLGTLGTVTALLSITNDIANMQSNFVLALRSTEYGLVFACGFKFLDWILFPLFTPYFEEAEQDNAE